jgi:hypothetical protein
MTEKKKPEPKKIPPEKWLPDEGFDSADYLDGKPPSYAKPVLKRDDGKPDD